MADGFKLRVKNLVKAFVTKKSDSLVIDNISINVRENEFLVVLGPGQCGKTVLLNMIAGLLKPTLGEVELDGAPVAGLDKRVLMVFQKTNLLPWLTVRKNVEIGMKYAGVEKEQRQKVSQYYIDLVGLQGFENAYPHQLSGGMKQRVGIARAYASAPEVLLMDEPFGALDAQTRYSMEDEILKIWGKDKRTIIFVTNNIEEAVYLADRVVLLSKRPAQVKKVYDLQELERPRDNMSARFLKIRQEIADQMDLDLGQ